MVYRKAPAAHVESTPYICPVANDDSLFPRPHPSASTAAQIGVASVAFGAFTGIPAILLGRLVLREIADGRELYTGERDAKLGLAFGWVGTLLSSALVVYWIASRSAAFGSIAVGVGLTAAGAAVAIRLWNGAPDALRVLAARPIRAAWPFWVATLGAVLCGGAGLHEKSRTEEELRSKASAACDADIRCAGEALYSAQFERARDCLREGRTVCVGAALAHVAQMGADLPGQEAEYRKRTARAQAEERARRAVEKDRRDAAAFGTKVDGVRKYLDDAAAKASRRLWLDARDALNRADADLAAFKGTKVETSERWRALHGRLDEIRRQIAPGVRGAEEARAAAQEAQRKREETIARRREVAEAAREASRRVRCCDGKLSPSCLCNGPSRGCCSHHGGICGCED